MIVQMLIGEVRDPQALASCEAAFAEQMAPVLSQASGFQSAHFGVEEGGLMALVIIMWDRRESAMAWANSRSSRTVASIMRQYTEGDVIAKFLRVEDRGKIERNAFN